MRARRPQRRGQAAVELALGALVFIGVLMAGIHLAEYAQLSLKVQDAQTFAVWDASLRRVQSRQQNGGTDLQPFQRTLDEVTGVGAMAKKRFADFNGLSGTDHGNVIGRALTQGSGVDVRCEREGSLRFRASPAAEELMKDVGGLKCSASAQVKAINVPERFLQRDNGGFFEHSIVRRQPIPICGMGLPVGGACTGALALLTNDWGLAKEETDTCKLDCRDSAYRGMIEAMFRRTPPPSGRAAAFAARFAGAVPASPADFHFSYSGVEEEMQQRVPGSEGQDTFITGGAGSGMVPELRTGRANEPRCFLGKKCR